MQKTPALRIGTAHRFITSTADTCRTAVIARCSCGWSSDCYAQLSDTQRAIEVHLRRARRADFEALIKRSSIGAAIADVETRGLDVHLRDLERELSHPRAKKPTPKRKARG